MSTIRRTSLIQGPPGVPANRSLATAWTPGTISSGGFAKTTVAVTGAVVGFATLPAWSATLVDGVFLTAQVTSANVVTVYMWNFSGSPQTPAAGTVYVEVLAS